MMTSVCVVLRVVEWYSYDVSFPTRVASDPGSVDGDKARGLLGGWPRSPKSSNVWEYYVLRVHHASCRVPFPIGATTYTRPRVPSAPATINLHTMVLGLYIRAHTHDQPYPSRGLPERNTDQGRLSERSTILVPPTPRAHGATRNHRQRLPSSERREGLMFNPPP